MRADATEAAGDPGTPIAFTAVTPGKKRDGIDTSELPWSVERFRVNPVITWSHDFGGKRLPIGRAEVEVIDTDEGENILAEVLFDVADPFAAEVDRKYRDGFLHAVSVSWDDVDEDGIPARVSGKKAVAHDLLEVAAVPVPGDPAALVERQVTALRGLRDDLNEVIAEVDPDPVPDVEAESEDESDEVAGAESDDESADTAAIVDDDHEAPHEKPEPGDADEPEEDPWPACAAVMVDVYDRGSDDSDEKRRRAYNALLPTYRRLGKEPPEWVGGDELRALDDDNWRALFLAGELEIAARAGAELSARNVQDLSDAAGDIQAGLDRITSLLSRVATKNQPVEDEAEGSERATLSELLGWLDTRLGGEEDDDDPAD